MRGSRKFRHGGGGGGGGPGQSDKKSSDNVFFFFLVLSLFLRKSNGQFQRNLSFFKVSEGVQHFPGGGGDPTFSSCLFPIETHITRDFPGGSGLPAPPPPLDPHLAVFFQSCPNYDPGANLTPPWELQVL